MNKVYDKNIFLSNRDDDEIIYWEDEWVYYKYPNKISEENKWEVECFDIRNNKFKDFSGMSADEIADYCFGNTMAFWNEIWKYIYDIAREDLVKRLKGK